MYLRHEGILGQKWGVRHGPPYPLSLSKHSAKERNLNPKTRIDGDPKTGRNSKRSLHLTDGQKRAIKIGTVVAGTALVAVGGYALYKNRDKLASFIKNGKTLVGAGDAPQFGNDGIIKSKAEILQHAQNRNRELESLGSKNQCTNVFMQMECELRGRNDVQAMSRVDFGNKPRKFDEVLNAFEGASLRSDELVKQPKNTNINSQKAFADYLINTAKMPATCRGYADMSISVPGHTYRHGLMWELKDGVATLFDGVNGTNANSYFSMLTSDARTQLFRTDNLNLDYNTIINDFVEKTR